MATLRWATRSVLTILEVALIAYVIMLIFGEDPINEGYSQALSVILGGLILNFGKASSFWFSGESIEDEKK